MSNLTISVGPKWYFNITFIVSNLLCFLDCFNTIFYGITQNAFDDYVTSTAIQTFENSGKFLCLYCCSVNPNCLAVFYHSDDRVCVLADKTYRNTDGLQSYPGMKYYRTLPKTCTDMLISEFNGSSHRQIDPDGTATQFGPSTVWCDVSFVNGKAVTVLNHDHEERTFVDGYEDRGSYNINITYSVGFEVAKKIVDISPICMQYVRWECFSAIMLESVEPREKVTFWKTRQMEPSDYFTGSRSTGKYCDCPPGNTCDSETGCYCDLNEFQWGYDAGTILNKHDLPITGFGAGDTGLHSGQDERGYHTIGPLICW